MSGEVMVRLIRRVSDEHREIPLPEGADTVRSSFKARDGRPRTFARLPGEDKLFDWERLDEWWRK